MIRPTVTLLPLLLGLLLGCSDSAVQAEARHRPGSVGAPRLGLADLGIALPAPGSLAGLEGVDEGERPLQGSSSVGTSSVGTSSVPTNHGGAELLGRGPAVMVDLDARETRPFTGDLDGIRERELLRVLVTPGRSDFFAAEGRLRGFEYELFRELSEEMDRARPAGAPPIQVAFIPMATEDLIPALLAGLGDVVAASMTVTEARAAQVAFTASYMGGVREVLVSHAGTEGPAGWEDLAGSRVHVAGGTTFASGLEARGAALVEAGLEPVEVVSTGRDLDQEDMLELVHSGALQYTVCDDHVAEHWADLLDGLRVHGDLHLRADAEIAWAVRPNAVELKALLDDFVSRHRRGTLIGNVLFKRYYRSTRWISNPLRLAETERLTSILEPLRAQAEAHGFEWEWIAAQAYQESRLDPRARSRSGALGLMQLLPSTGADMGVTNLLDPEQNLTAGCRYMAWLREHFVNDPDLDEDVRIDFCLAAYNAGPSRVRRWREAAVSRGLDPDRWFGSVELLALEDVGLQPVQYVGNISKYRTLYSMLMEGETRHAAARERLERALGDGAR